MIRLISPVPFYPYLLSVLFLFTQVSIASDIPNIAAASSVKFALQDIIKAFKQDTGLSVRVSYSSSGNLTRQIQQGAPFELFLSANKLYVDQLYQQNKTNGKGFIYALGRLVLLTPKHSTLVLDDHLSAVRESIQTGQLQRIAIANPIHAPYGVAAKEVLLHLGLWKLTKPHLVLGENIAQAAQFASSGAAQVGLISYSLANTPFIQKNTRFILLPLSLHHPLEQSMVLLNNAGHTSKLFFNYLQQNKARTILSQYGYSFP